jgi:hypothetical protein
MVFLYAVGNHAGPARCNSAGRFENWQSVPHLRPLAERALWAFEAFGLEIAARRAAVMFRLKGAARGAGVTFASGFEVAAWRAGIAFASGFEVAARRASIAFASGFEVAAGRTGITFASGLEIAARGASITFAPGLEIAARGSGIAFASRLEVATCGTILAWRPEFTARRTVVVIAFERPGQSGLFSFFTAHRRPPAAFALFRLRSGCERGGRPHGWTRRACRPAFFDNSFRSDGARYLIGNLDHRTHFFDVVNTHDVGAIQNGGRYSAGRREERLVFRRLREE